MLQKEMVLTGNDESHRTMLSLHVTIKMMNYVKALPSPEEERGGGKKRFKEDNRAFLIFFFYNFIIVHFS